MRMRERVGIFAVIVFLGVSLCASAGLALSADTSAMTGWYGTSHFNSGDGLVVDMDYAVYKPGTYVGVAVPTNEYVYAYQVFQLSSSNLTWATVGILEGSDAANAQTDAGYGVSGGKTPFLTYLSGNSFVTLFNPQLAVGQHSVVLLFTSPNGPTTTDASVADSGKSDQQLAPTPLPEPATLMLLGLGLAAIRRRRGV